MDSEPSTSAVLPASQRKLISAVIPAYNEEGNVDELLRRLAVVAASLADKYDFEFIVIENGSMDSTFDKLMAIREREPRLRVIRFSRNFGIEPALSAGLKRAKGDAAVIMCGDLQDPPELIPEFVAKWEAGFQNVYAIIKGRGGESLSRRVLTRAFYWLANRLNPHPVPENVSDFRLVDRRLYVTLNTMGERNRMLRTMWGWIGYKSVGITYDRPPRVAGTSTYRVLGNIAFALHGLASSSTTPLKLVPLLGFTLSGLSIISIGVLEVKWVLQGVPFSGFGSLVGLNLLLFGVLFFFLGIISEYVGIIYEEVRSRPLFVVNDTYGFDE